MNNLKEHCHCGHDKSMHHEGKDDCLGMYCDCREYVNEYEPKPAPKRVAPPIEDPADEEDSRDTLPTLPAWPTGWP